MWSGTFLFCKVLSNSPGDQSGQTEEIMDQRLLDPLTRHLPTMKLGNCLQENGLGSESLKYSEREIFIIVCIIYCHCYLGRDLSHQSIRPWSDIYDEMIKLTIFYLSVSAHSSLLLLLCFDIQCRNYTQSTRTWPQTKYYFLVTSLVVLVLVLLLVVVVEEQGIVPLYDNCED